MDSAARLLRTVRSSVLAAVVLSLAWHAYLTHRHLKRWRSDFSLLLAVGRENAALEPFQGVRSYLGPLGYDGQFYYALAQKSPLATHHAPTVDNPAARQLRILYPALCWAASLGHGPALPAVMYGVNLAFAGALAGLGALWCRRCGVSEVWGVTLPAAVNTAAPLLRSLTDVSAMFAAFALVYVALTDRRAGWALLAAAAALLAREQNLVLVLVVGGWSALAGRWRVAAAVAAAGAVWAGWVAYVGCLYGTWPFAEARGNFAAPLAGLTLRWELILAHPGGRLWKMPVTDAAFTGYLAVLATVAAAGLWRCRTDELLPLGVAGAGAALAAVAGPYIYVDYWAYSRAFFWLPMGVWTFVVQRGYERGVRLFAFPVLLSYWAILSM